MEYDLVFDAAQQPFEWKWVAFGLVFVAASLIFWKAERAVAKERKASLFIRVFFGFSIVWTMLLAGGMFVGFWNARNARDPSRYREVEGIVENFDPMPHEGHKHESFTVRGQRFSYSDYEITPYFRQAASHGGPIREGLQVRIQHVDGRISRLEVERGSATALGVVSSHVPPVGSHGSSSAPPRGLRGPPEPWTVLLMLALGWPFLTALIAIVGGWRRLAERFPAPAVAPGDTYPMQSVRLSLFGAYRGCVDVTLTENGLHMIPMILFRVLHPPILIPWSDVSACDRRDFLFLKRARITVGGPAGHEIDISGRAAPVIELAWRSRNPGIGHRSG